MQPENPNKVKMVKCKTLHPIRLMRDPVSGKLDENGVIVKEGQEVMLTEEEVKEFCEKKFDNVMPYSGERFKDDGAGPGKIVRAIRL